MKTIKGPGLYLVQFYRDQSPFNSLANMAAWAASLGYTGLQIPSWVPALLDLDKAAESTAYCDDVKGMLAGCGLELAELGSYIQGQCLALCSHAEEAFRGFYPAGLRGYARAAWAAGQLKKSISASVNFGTKNISVLSGGFAWHAMYPWPQRPAGMIDRAFTELARLWRPLLDAADEAGVTFGFELHPGCDLFDGATYEMFLDKVNNHPAACLTYDPSHLLLQQLDYLEFIRLYGGRIRAFHVKDAEFYPSGRMGIYGGYQPWAKRPGRFRSPGDGQVDFKRVFSLLAEAGYEGWAILEWECFLKSPQQGALQGAAFIRDHIIQVTEVAFDDFSGAATAAGI
ncbi:MAG: sugar phosphate isomerase/epimerase [Chitinivibrionales bacterium]|nr:sugar phosphate isomerase/epimerase [Chitinivibrionales bacterium]